MVCAGEVVGGKWLESLGKFFYFVLGDIGMGGAMYMVYNGVVVIVGNP